MAPDPACDRSRRPRPTRMRRRTGHTLAVVAASGREHGPFGQSQGGPIGPDAIGPMGSLARAPGRATLGPTGRLRVHPRPPAAHSAPRRPGCDRVHARDRPGGAARASARRHDPRRVVRRRCPPDPHHHVGAQQGARARGHQGRRDREGPRGEVEHPLRRQVRRRQHLVPDHDHQRKKRALALRRDLRLCRDQPVQGRQHAGDPRDRVLRGQPADHDQHDGDGQGQACGRGEGRRVDQGGRRLLVGELPGLHVRRVLVPDHVVNGRSVSVAVRRGVRLRRRQPVQGPGRGARADPGTPTPAPTPTPTPAATRPDAQPDPDARPVGQPHADPERRPPPRPPEPELHRGRSTSATGRAPSTGPRSPPPAAVRVPEGAEDTTYTDPTTPATGRRRRPPGSSWGRTTSRSRTRPPASAVAEADYFVSTAAGRERRPAAGPRSRDRRRPRGARTSRPGSRRSSTGSTSGPASAG